MEKSDSKEHKLSKIRCTLFSLTKLSVPRTIEKHCRATIWLLRPKIWTHFQTITTHYDFPDGVYYCTELIQIKIKCFIMMTGNIKQLLIYVHSLSDYIRTDIFGFVRSKYPSLPRFEENDNNESFFCGPVSAPPSLLMDLTSSYNFASNITFPSNLGDKHLDHIHNQK